MCGRYSLEARADEIAEAFAAAEAFAFEARYNIAPTQNAPVVRVDPATGERRVAALRWGLPSQADNPRPLINARSETVDSKPSFRDAFRSRRCVVPATGFYEWQKLGSARQPFHIQRTDHGLFAFAGIWERDAFAILTTGANRTVAGIHDRMPVILAPETYSAWLESDAPGRLKTLLAPAADDLLEAIPVSSRVNSAANDDPACVQPLKGPIGGLLFE